MESPGSPLSEISSIEFQEDVKAEHRSLSDDAYHDADHDSARPSKRQRTNGGASSAMVAFRSAASPETAPLPDADADIYISEDTDGSVPASPHHNYSGSLQDEEAFGQEQVTVCKWDRCEAGDLGNMDRLVDHLHDDHIGTRQKKYSCEWTDCVRKGIPHASGYALRAHMRSHTREKPFYCTLPECDRAFTRSDALAKHMRTVHETEALRPSDPVPKHHSSNPLNKNQRLRLVFKGHIADRNGSSIPASPLSQHPAESEYEHNNVIFRPLDQTDPHSPHSCKFPQDIHLTPEELRLPAPELVRLLYQQIRWATQESRQLSANLDILRARHMDEWRSKELVLENVMEAEHNHMKRTDRLLKGNNPRAAALRATLGEDIRISETLDVRPVPSWREHTGAKEEERVVEAAGALANLAGPRKTGTAANGPAMDLRNEHMSVGDCNGRL